MSILSIILDVTTGDAVQAAQGVVANAEGAAQGAAQGAAGAAPQGGGMVWIMLIGIFAIMYFFMIRPQRKQQKELQNFRAGLKKGDKVVTAGGIYGTIDQVEEKTVLIKVDGDVKLRVAKDSLVKDFSDVQK